MSDLISRKALIQRFWEFTNGGKQRYLIPEEIWEMVELMPTAYDVKSVVEQLERQKDICKERRIRSEGGAMKYHYEGKEIALFEAIEIVKGGAV